MEKLKPCPFCGGSPKESCYATLSYIECEKGCVRRHGWGPESIGRDGVLLNGLDGVYWCDLLREMWNTRAVDQAAHQPDERTATMLCQLIAEAAGNQRALAGIKPQRIESETAQAIYKALQPYLTKRESVVHTNMRAMRDGDGADSPSNCHSDRDGECGWVSCPQTRDTEPGRSGRSCPLWNNTLEDGVSDDN